MKSQLCQAHSRWDSIPAYEVWLLLLDLPLEQGWEEFFVMVEMRDVTAPPASCPNPDAATHNVPRATAAHAPPANRRA